MALAAVAAVVLLGAVLKRGPRNPAAELAARGDFRGALAAAAGGSERDALLAVAVAAKHLLQLERAEESLARLLATEDDGEAWLERGLVAAYRGRHDHARDCFSRAVAARADLLEPISLHRAWVDLRAGERARAGALFEEIEAPIESKLRSDIGPGDPLFSEWFVQAADLWEARGDAERAAWARAQGLAAAPASRLLARLASGEDPAAAS